MCYRVYVEIIIFTYQKFFSPCRHFHCLIKATSSVLMAYRSVDIIVHIKKFVIALVSVYRCLGLAYPYGLFHKSSPSVGLPYLPLIYEMVFGG